MPGLHLPSPQPGRTLLVAAERTQGRGYPLRQDRRLLRRGRRHRCFTRLDQVFDPISIQMRTDPSSPQPPGFSFPSASSPTSRACPASNCRPDRFSQARPSWSLSWSGGGKRRNLAHVRRVAAGGHAKAPAGQLPAVRQRAGRASTGAVVAGMVYGTAVGFMICGPGTLKGVSIRAPAPGAIVAGRSGRGLSNC